MAAVIYLDYAAAALPHPQLAQWMAEMLAECPWNPHGGTSLAEPCRRRLLRAEERLLSLLEIPDSEAQVVWTSGVTEALNLAARAVCVECSGENIVETGAHPSLRLPFSARQQGGMVAVSAVNSETGAVADLPGMRSKYPGHLLAVDGAQAFGKVPVPWQGARVDLLALSSRKIGGPAAVGALVVRRGVKVTPLLVGGGQQHGLRAGTVDVAGVECFVRVAEDVCRRREECVKRIRPLQQFFWEQLQMNFPDSVRISPLDGSPWIAMCAFPGYEGAVLVRMLAQRHGILVSSASACTAEAGERSAALRALGVPERVAMGAMRVSFGERSTRQDVGALIAALADVLRDY